MPDRERVMCGECGAPRSSDGYTAHRPTCSRYRPGCINDDDRPALTPSETAGRTPQVGTCPREHCFAPDVACNMGEADVRDCPHFNRAVPVSQSPAVGEPTQEQDQDQNRLAETEKNQPQSPLTSPNPLPASDAVGTAATQARTYHHHALSLGRFSVDLRTRYGVTEFNIFDMGEFAYMIRLDAADREWLRAALSDASRAEPALAPDRSRSTPQALAAPALTPSVASPGDANGE